MLPGQPSRTLLVPAVARAAHQLFDAPLILDDPLAVGLVPQTSRETLLATAEEHRTEAARLSRSLFAVRSRFAEDRLAAAVSRGVRQYVMLGAGIETFPWRQRDLVKVLRIFFSDHPATLSWAKNVFRERGLAVPANLLFVPCDLEQRQIGQHLAGAGLAIGLPTFVSILGVLQFLTAQTIDALFAFFASLPAGSEAVFSFVIPDDELGGLDLNEIRSSMARGSHMGEPWLTRRRPADMLIHLRSFGYRQIFHLAPEEAQRRYFSARSDRLAAPLRDQLIAVIP